MTEMEIQKLKCKRCGGSWYPKIIEGKIKKPKHCAKCNSPYWWKDKVKFR